MRTEQTMCSGKCEAMKGKWVKSIQMQPFRCRTHTQQFRSVLDCKPTLLDRDDETSLIENDNSSNNVTL